MAFSKGKALVAVIGFAVGAKLLRKWKGCDTPSRFTWSRNTDDETYKNGESIHVTIDDEDVEIFNEGEEIHMRDREGNEYRNTSRGRADFGNMSKEEIDEFLREMMNSFNSNGWKGFV